MATSYGFDTANYIYNVAGSAKAKFGTGVFYLRYLNPSPAASLMTSSTAVKEFRSGWDNGERYFVPITEPTQSRLNGTQAMGTADATTFCAAIKSVYFAVVPLYLPSTNHVNVYLALESPTNLSTAYWNGWSAYVDGYALSGGVPLYPGIYCNPHSTAKNCSSVGAGNFCWSVWSSEPEPCAACGRFGSVSWSAYNCYNAPGSVSRTLLWQMAEQGGCQGVCGRGTYPNVDPDATNPSYTEKSHMFYLGYRP
jgi:hypothetical protein